MTQELISAAQIPNEWTRAAETFLKRRVFAVEADAVRQLSDLYARAYSDLRAIAHATAEGMGITTASSAWREQFEQYARGRIERLAAEGLQVAATSASIAAKGSYYGRLWMLDMLTHESTTINRPMLNASMLQEQDANDALITELMGRDWRAQYANEMDSLVVDLRRAIGTGMQQGEGIPAIMRRVAGTMGVETDRRRGAIGSVERQGYRANFNRVQTMTRTVVNKVSNDGAIAAYRANADIIIGYDWLAARDERTCPQCQFLNGRFYPRDSHFRPPAHPNCRCTIVPVINDVQAERPREMPPELLSSWADGWGMKREIADFINMPSPRAVRAPAPKPPTEIRTMDGVFKSRVGNPGDTLDSLNVYMAEADDALSYAMGDPNFGMLEVDYSRAEDYFLINREVVKKEAAAFVQESMDIHYSRDYLLNLARERALENGVELAGDAIEAAYNATYAARAEAIETLARIGNVRLTPAQLRRLETARNGDYLSMVYSREGSSTGSLQNVITRATQRQRKPGGSQNYAPGAIEEARANFREWVQGIES